ncbi:MAG: pullulanase [Ignavibacteriae bacterium]|nr:MAG: pullulanase [Ignavibacteriota bacterium]
MKNKIVSVAVIIFSLMFIGSKFYIKNEHPEKLNDHISQRNNPQTSDKKLGSFVQDGKTFFRLFAPSAENVKLVIFEQPEQIDGKEFDMIRDEDGVWETMLKGELYGSFYGYKVKHAVFSGSEDIICLDPYAKAVTTFNTYFNPRRAIVVEEDNYDWEGDEWMNMDWRDLIIYEMHIKDMTEHSSSGVRQRGTYKGLIEKGKTGGVDYLNNLGVNAVELLPAQEFANIEIPFKDSLNGKFNTWNQYERNHWGYMTAAYFAPEAYYSENVRNIKFNQWSGKDARAINDFKDMVKAFHKDGIAVIMDVVYNHISEYELGNFKEIDKKYYFRLDEKGNYIAQSYCGNDFKTEQPMVRRLIIESVLYWMKEYHVDGFRFDLGKLIDWETIEEVIREAKKVNPNVIFVCEPWGGGYDPAGFSARGWGVWNDQIRNGIKGENPFDGHGWIFGKWYGNNDSERIKSYVNGTLTKDEHGLFMLPEHSVNYLECHDGYTFGDFIRLGLGDVYKDQKIVDLNKNVKLTEQQLKLNKLGALFLFTSRGITMISEGQEFARSKVIATDTNFTDPHQGMIDHNSYDKDNETNYINYEHASINEDLFNYYKGLIKLRKNHKAFRRADYNQVHFFDIKENPFAIGYLLKYKNETFIVLLNANTKLNEEYILPEGEWSVLVNSEKAGIKSLGTVQSIIKLDPSTGIVLKKK